MTHDELLAKVEKQTIHIANKIKPVANDCEKEIGGFANALRAVVELTKNLQDTESWQDNAEYSAGYNNAMYEVIQAIEKELG